MRAKLGVCQWFHYEDHRSVELAVQLLRDLGVRHLRTGISWADYHRPNGPAWYQFQMEALAEFDLLVSIWHTPPSIAAGGTCAGPPCRLSDYAAFVGQAILEYGRYFETLELWNEPNNRLKWNFPAYDPEWRKFGEMIRLAAATARSYGKPTVLGGMIPVDHHWIELVKGYGTLDEIDAIGIHAFPEMWSNGPINWEWWTTWKGWRQKIEYIQPFCDGRPVWVTETGLATWDLEAARPARCDLQVTKLHEAVNAPAHRVYWYCLVDLDPRREAIEGFHVDEFEYHMGLVDWQGRPKPAYHAMKRLLAVE